MARILLVVPSLPPAPDPESLLGWRLANLLAECQHEIKLLTGPHRHQDFPDFHSRVEVLQIFRRWSLLEVPKLFPVWFDWRPEVLHLLPPPKPKALWYSLPLVPSAFPMLPRPRVVASFWQFPRGNWMFQAATVDAVTVASESHRNRLTAQPGLQPRVETLLLFDGRRPFATKTEILPPAFDPYLFVPGPLSEHENPIDLLEILLQVFRTRPNWKVVIGGRLEDLGFKNTAEWRARWRAAALDSRIFFTGSIDLTQTFDLLEGAAAIMTATLKLESFQSTATLHAAHTFSKPILINSMQATFDPFPWLNDQSALICSRETSDIASHLESLVDEEQTRQRLRLALEGIAPLMTDQATNVLNRLYSAGR
ncbi:MAG: glycosyltransferase family 4 protein [Bdellovibrionales bacterium]|nr:glycosyltransferase family 4 protein [Bdellovibrionales bacterium]